MVRCKTAKILWNSLTQNEGHRRRCSLFSIERQFPKLARRASRRRRLNSRSPVESASSSKLAKDHENQSCPCHTSPHRERRDRTSSGEVEADKLAGPAHASLSE